MSPKLIAILGITGIVVFCLAFFRTGSPEIKGLERPSVSLSNFHLAVEKANPASSDRSSRFKSAEKNNDRKASRINRNNNNNNRRKAAANARNKASNKRKIGTNKAAGIKGAKNANRAKGRNARREAHLKRIREKKDRLKRQGVQAKSLGDEDYIEEPYMEDMDPMDDPEPLMDEEYPLEGEMMDPDGITIQ